MTLPIRRDARRRPTVVVAAALSAGLAAGLLTGCQSSNPITAEPYAASDGVDVDLGSVRAANLLVLAAEQGAPGTVIGSVTNEGTEPVTVEIGVADALTSIDVEPGGTALLGPDHAEVPVEAVDAPPGALLQLRLTTTSEGSTTVTVPVLDGALPYYATLVPAP